MAFQRGYKACIFESVVFVVHFWQTKKPFTTIVASPTLDKTIFNIGTPDVQALAKVHELHISKTTCQLQATQPHVPWCRPTYLHCTGLSGVGGRAFIHTGSIMFSESSAFRARAAITANISSVLLPLLIFVSLLCLDPVIPFALLRCYMLLKLQNAYRVSFMSQIVLMCCMLKQRQRRYTSMPRRQALTYLKHIFATHSVVGLFRVLRIEGSSSESLKQKVEHAVTLSQKGKDKTISGCLCKGDQESEVVWRLVLAPKPILRLSAVIVPFILHLV